MFKQIEIIRSMDGLDGKIQDNFEYESLPYFYNSSEEEMHEIELLPADYSRSFSENKIQIFKT